LAAVAGSDIETRVPIDVAVLPMLVVEVRPTTPAALVPAATAAVVVAILVISVLPTYAQGQQPSAAKLKADAKNVVKIISSDKLKIQTYCEFLDLNDQVEEAVRQQDTKKAEDLSQKAQALQRKLGPEFTTLADGLKDMDDLNTQGAREIGSIIGKLEEFCGD
jgi:hypothetical protein